MSTFLSRDETAELTGAKTRAKQIAVLKRNRIRFTLNAGGWPVVARREIEQGLPPAGVSTEPDWGALEAH